MERLTDKHYTGDGYYMKCSGRLRCMDNCCECEQLDEVIDRLGAYEDTGLEPEEAVRDKALLKEIKTICTKNGPAAQAERVGALGVIIQLLAGWEGGADNA